MYFQNMTSFSYFLVTNRFIVSQAKRRCFRKKGFSFFVTEIKRLTKQGFCSQSVSVLFLLHRGGRKNSVVRREEKMSNTEMNNPAMEEEEEDEGDVFLGESDVLHEIDVDGEGFSSFFLFHIQLFISLSLIPS